MKIQNITIQWLKMEINIIDFIMSIQKNIIIYFQLVKKIIEKIAQCFIIGLNRFKIKNKNNKRDIYINFGFLLYINNC